MAITVYMTRGLPGSGKSHWVKALMAEHPGAYVRTNKDLLRECLHDGKWSRDNEQMILRVRDLIIEQGILNGKHVLIDDTGFGKKHEERIRAIAKKYNASFELVDFTDVPLEVCLERDRKRHNSVGYGVIMDMYNQFLRPKIEPAPYNPELPDIVIVDVDGTVAQMNGRGPFEYHRVGEDLPRMHVIQAIKGFTAKWIFVSGRDECCRAETEAWLEKQFSRKMTLFMRAAGDMRRDSIVKTEIYEREIKGKFNVTGVFEDRLQVSRTWAELGLGDRLFRVGPVDQDDF